MKVKDVMTPLADGFSPDTDLRTAGERMKALGLDPMPILRDGCLVGMITDLSVEEAAAQAGLAAGTLPVTTAMVEAHTCREDDDLEEGAHALQRGDDGLIVVNGIGHVTGVVDRRSLQPSIPVRPGAEAGGAVAAHHVPFSPYAQDPVDHMSQESFPASDPPPPEVDRPA